MTNEELNDMIDRIISDNPEVIDVKAASVNLTRKVDLSSDYVREIVRSFLEQKIRSRIAQIKGSDNIRDYFAVPVDGKQCVYANVSKSLDDNALEKSAERMSVQMIGIKISRDKIMSRVHQIRHQTEIKDDGTIDIKTPDTEI